jgi:hypothetical protein
VDQTVKLALSELNVPLNALTIQCDTSIQRAKKAQQIEDVIPALGTDFLRMDQLSLVMSLPGKVLSLHGADVVHQEQIASKFSFSVDGLKPNQWHLARCFLLLDIDRREDLIFTRKSIFSVLSAQKPASSSLKANLESFVVANHDLVTKSSHLDRHFQDS